jgi:tetratricopeptide (TPR) repeat protein
MALTVGCHSLAAAGDPLAPPVTLSDAQRASAQVHVMAGEMAAGRNQPALAAAQFLQALELVPDIEMAQRSTALALSANDRELALRAARKWQTLAPREMDPREIIGRISVESGNVPEALEQMRFIVEGHAGGVDEGLQHTARLLAQSAARSAEAALTVMQKLAAGHSGRSAAHQAVAIVSLRFGRLEQAELSARKALELAPDDKGPPMLLAGVLARRDKLAEAETLFEGIVARDPNPAELRLSFSRVLLDAGQRAAAQAQLRKALKDKPGNVDAQYALGVLAIGDRDYAEAERHLRAVLQGNRSQDAAFQLGFLAERRDDHEQALDWYGRVTTGNQAIEALVRRAHALGRLQRLDEARELLGNLRRQLPNLSSRFYIVEATLLSDLGQPAAALEVFDAGLREHPSDADILYSRSLLHENQKRIDLAEADLRAMLRLDPEDSRAMNALGYMLTVHTRRYSEARDLIERAFRLSPDDAAIMDSLGWVRFKLGDAKTALELLQQALNKEPDPEIAAHLGEVLWTLGEKDRARAVWDEALSKAPDHRVLNDTIQRFTAPVE